MSVIEHVLPFLSRCLAFPALPNPMNASTDHFFSSFFILDTPDSTTEPSAPPVQTPLALMELLLSTLSCAPGGLISSDFSTSQAILSIPTMFMGIIQKQKESFLFRRLVFGHVRLRFLTGDN